MIEVEPKVKVIKTEVTPGVFDVEFVPEPGAHAGCQRIKDFFPRTSSGIALNDKIADLIDDINAQAAAHETDAD